MCILFGAQIFFALVQFVIIFIFDILLGIIIIWVDTQIRNEYSSPILS